MVSTTLRQMYRSLIEKWREIRAEYTGISWFALALLIFAFVPDKAAQIEWWVKVVKWATPYILSPVGRFGLLACGLGIILWDRRRHHKPRYDKSLIGRTRGFCDELRAFQEELGKEPTIDYKSGDSAAQFTEKNKELAAREQRMHHGFQLRFAEKAAHLFHEHGAEMRESYELAVILRGRIDTDERLNSVIKIFSDLASMSEG